MGSFYIDSEPFCLSRIANVFRFFLPHFDFILLSDVVNILVFKSDSSSFPEVSDLENSFPDYKIICPPPKSLMVPF